ncbi:MAG: Gfo/Idh/MocA family oxidoreductase [Pseudomonadota bacterium]
MDYISICSPNYLHDAHIRFGLRSDCDVICEKPLVVNPWNLDGIQSIEESSGRKLNAILQLRVHPNVLRLKGKVERELSETKKVIDLTYITPRGRWYDVSWKGVLEKSGGIVTNIGVHFFDMLGWIYGDVQDSQVYHRQPKSASGVLEYNDAVVNWYLSTDGNDLSLLNKDSTKPFRSLTIDDEEFDFSLGFNDLHTLSYEQILLGNGFGVEDSRPSIETVFDIKTMKIRDSKDGHWFLRKKGGA